MLLKKINPSWCPVENRELQVGETIDFGGDPKQLILEGNAVAVDDMGVELSAFELYGVVVDDEYKEFKEYIAMKKQQAMKAKLEEQAEELKAQLEETKTATAEVTQGEATTVTEIKAKRLAALEKARAARAAKKK